MTSKERYKLIAALKSRFIDRWPHLRICTASSMNFMFVGARVVSIADKQAWLVPWWSVGEGRLQMATTTRRMSTKP